VSSIVFGLAAAVAVTVSLLCSSRSIRLLGSTSVLAWVMLVGLLVTLSFALLDLPKMHPTAGQVWLLLFIGASNVGGLLLTFAALRLGKVGMVMPIIATEGAISASVSAARGERLGHLAWACLVVVVVGVVVAAMAPDPSPLSHERQSLSVLIAVTAALVLGTGTYATGHLASRIPLSWLVLPPRLVGVVVLAVPMLAARRLRMTRAAFPLVVASGVAEVLFFVLFALGARHSIAVTSVLAAQFSVMGPATAYVLFRERLGLQQKLGAAFLILGVTGLALVHSR
jgi:hypothetical protein